MPPPPPSSSRTYDAIVIGAGALGTAIALELSRIGVRTVGLDRMNGPGEGSTSDSASIVRLYASTYQLAALSLDAVHCWARWPEYIGTHDEFGLARYLRTGSLLLKSRAGHHERAIPALRELGISFEEWDTEKLGEHIPIFDIRSFWPPRPVDDPGFADEPNSQLDGAVYVPEGGYIDDPRLAAHNLAVAAQGHGATFLFRATVVQILQHAGRVSGVHLADGRVIAAPIVVNAAGPHAAILNRMAGVEASMQIHTRPLRHELHVVPAPPEFDARLHGLQVSDGDLGINFRPEGAHHLLVGSEDPACDPLVWVEDPDSHDHRPTRSQWERQVYRLARRVPSLPIPRKIAGLAGLYDVTVDSLPIYDRSELPGYYMAVGTNGNQFKAAPSVGYMMAQLIRACENGHDHDARSVKVNAKNIDATLDMGAFSRNRSANAHLSVV
jgi:glycine/D-amino acid oxidase-like deaminating enzyme